MTRCGFCCEEYSPGQRIHDCQSCRTTGFVEGCDRGYDSYPHGEAEYWAHTRASRHHQALLELQRVTMSRLLNQLDDVLPAARAHQKLMRNPTLAPLRRLFR